MHVRHFEAIALGTRYRNLPASRLRPSPDVMILVAQRHGDALRVQGVPGGIRVAAPMPCSLSPATAVGEVFGSHM